MPLDSSKVHLIQKNRATHTTMRVVTNTDITYGTILCCRCIILLNFLVNSLNIINPTKKWTLLFFFFWAGRLFEINVFDVLVIILTKSKQHNQAIYKYRTVRNLYQQRQTKIMMNSIVNDHVSDENNGSAVANKELRFRRMPLSRHQDNIVRSSSNLSEKVSTVIKLFQKI